MHTTGISVMTSSAYQVRYATLHTGMGDLICKTYKLNDGDGRVWWALPDVQHWLNAACCEKSYHRSAQWRVDHLRRWQQASFLRGHVRTSTYSKHQADAGGKTGGPALQRFHEPTIDTFLLLHLLLRSAVGDNDSEQTGEKNKVNRSSELVSSILRKFILDANLEVELASVLEDGDALGREDGVAKDDLLCIDEGRVRIGDIVKSDLVGSKIKAQARKLQRECGDEPDMMSLLLDTTSLRTTGLYGFLLGVLAKCVHAVFDDAGFGDSAVMAGKKCHKRKRVDPVLMEELAFKRVGDVIAPSTSSAQHALHGLGQAPPRKCHRPEESCLARYWLATKKQLFNASSMGIAVDKGDAGGRKVSMMVAMGPGPDGIVRAAVLPQQALSRTVSVGFRLPESSIAIFRNRLKVYGKGFHPRHPPSSFFPEGVYAKLA